MARRLLLVSWCALVLLVGACGESDTATAPDPATAPSSDATAGAERAETGPACDEIWRDGGRIPETYAGCEAEGTWVRADRRRCESGQVLVSYADRYYGAIGYPVNVVPDSLSKSRQYATALRSCG